VEVDGEDEVSELQKDFNAMADDLGSAVGELRSERDKVERLLETQRELVASVSHELRTPVATMRGYLESALYGEDSLPKALRNDLEVVEREAIRLQRLIDDLFVLSRAEAGRLPLEIKPTDVGALLSRCADAVADAAWRTGKVEVVVVPAPDLPPALADEGRLEQSVRNLLSNAIRHTPPGGIVALGATAGRDTVAIEVKDTGDGIAPDELDRIFERFYRSDGARKLDRSGAGLGLALVRELVEAMNGSVTAESEPGSGSRFTLRLPRA
jgi:signal transduction histidine kinase